MSPFHIIFCGTPEFAVPSLQALAKDQRFQVDLVITQPDKPVGRKQVLTPSPVKLAAQALQIPVLQPQDINEVVLPAARYPLPAIRCDFLVVVAYGQLLKQPILDLPKIAPINVHASLLPRWRGASPMQHTLLNGETETGVTVQRMVKALDAGPILGHATYRVSPRETAETLNCELSKLGADLLVKTLSEPLHETVQEEAAMSVCRKLTRADGVVNPLTMTAAEIDRKVRALTPWPGVTVSVQGRLVKLLKTELEASKESIPLPCAQGTMLYLSLLQEPGKRPVSGVAWMRGVKQ